ncbi:MAG: LysM peptidoglycan-binding domain-containing protein [Gorillibacterium sp.]|nr:LysM peptidoglycan-binding domain-containing protein [Gorillibacterium sp.]
MTEHRSGLRFDIYERVHLPEGFDGILELEAAELAPHIQVVEEADYAVVKGNLWLTGAYRGENGLTGQSFEHLIPVEITMPLSRIHCLEDVRVVIDQFDVELMTSKSMNVTGVLSLHGLEMLPLEERDVWEPSSQEETVFVYEHTFDDAQGLSPQVEEETFEAQEQETAYVNEKVNLAAYFPTVEEPREPRTEWSVAVLEEETVEPIIQEVAQYLSVQSFDEEDSYSRFNAELDETDVPQDQSLAEIGGDKPFVAPFLNAARKADTEVIQSVESRSIKESPQEQEQRVYMAAFAAKQASPSISHLHSLVRTREAAEVTEATRSEAEFQNSVEWKKLFIHDNEQKAFKQLRICIVQKEETLESIANRYGMNSREIVLYNRINGLQVNEGQILYIPLH